MFLCGALTLALQRSALLARLDGRASYTGVARVLGELLAAFIAALALRQSGILLDGVHGFWGAVLAMVLAAAALLAAGIAADAAASRWRGVPSIWSRIRPGPPRSAPPE
jgi:hypothetical protein